MTTISEKNKDPDIIVNGVIVNKNSIAATLPSSLKFRVNRINRALPPQIKRPSVRDDKPVEPVPINKNIVPDHLIERRTESSVPIAVVTEQPVTEVPVVETIEEDTDSPSVVSQEPLPHQSQPISRNNRTNVKVDSSRTITLQPLGDDREAIEINLQKLEIPDYESMSRNDHLRERSKLLVKVNTIRETSKEYRVPTPEEFDRMSTTEIHLYIHGYTSFIAIRRVLSNYRFFWCACCMVAEVICVKGLGWDYARGYTAMQVKNYIDIEASMIQLGEEAASQGLAMDSWHPVLKMAFIGLINLAALVLLRWLAKWINVDAAGADLLVNLLMEFVTGKRELPVELVEGITKAATENPSDPFTGIVKGLTNFDWSGGINMFKNFMTSKSTPTTGDRQIYDS